IIVVTLISCFLGLASCGNPDTVRQSPLISTETSFSTIPSQKEIKATYDLSAGDDYVPIPVQAKKGDVISIKSALPSMECNTHQSGETTCEDGEKGIEFKFEGFEQCKLTHSPQYAGHLHDGSLEKCSEFIFDKTPVVCPGDEEECSVIILSKGTMEKKRGGWPNRLKKYEKWKDKIEDARKRRRESLKQYKSGEHSNYPTIYEVAELAYDKAVGEGKKGPEVDKAVKEAAETEEKRQKEIKATYGPSASADPSQKEIKATYDLSAGDDYVPIPVQAKKGDVISIKSALPSMECNTHQSGE
ncbi:MAG: hypothetical protein LE168_03565, partial [Endomicrobium sp.]|nr:hypothetical protein [Endomicrobium sp.]